MGRNKFQILHKGNVLGSSVINVQLPPRGVNDDVRQTNIVKVNNEGTALMQVKHQFINIGETIHQVKYKTAAQVTEYGTVKITQFKQEISSRSEEVWYFKNSTGLFEGSLQDAKQAFPDIDFDDLKIEETHVDRENPEFANIILAPNEPQWTTQNEYDGEKTGKPTTWDKWADATQLALDGIGLIPGIGEFADCANGIISLARGNYADAALSFAAMIPFFGTGATIAKNAKKLKKIVNKSVDNKGVYDLILKNSDDIKSYVGQSKDVYKRMTNHFGKRGKLKMTQDVLHGALYKMPGSIKKERELYEQLLILRKYEGQINPKKNIFAKLLNKVNPVGGRYNLKSPEGLKKFYKEAEAVAKKYNLPTEFDKAF